MSDHYKTLGVSRQATQDEIRKAYKKLARENHPDTKPGDVAAAERFKQANSAYDVLGDPDKRKKYDQYGDAFEQMGGGPRGGPQVGPDSIFGSGAFDLEELLGGLGGRRGGPRRPRSARGADMRTDVTIPFQMAADGGQYDVLVQRESQTERLAVKIPPGVMDGDVIRLAGQGEAGSGGGAQGDLLVTVRVAAHPQFRREGANVVYELPVSIVDAALGAKLEVPTLSEGAVMLTVPPGTSSGAKLRLRERGFVDRKTGRRGDQFVEVKILAPKTLTDRARSLLEELRSELP